MDINLQLILPSLLLPLALSALLFTLSQVANKRLTILLWGLPLIWLPSCFWLTGLPDQLPPQEAKDWLWIILLISFLFNISLTTRKRVSTYLQIVLLAIYTVVLAWPVLGINTTFQVFSELIILILVGSTILKYADSGKTSTPALILSISSGGMGLVVALGGSLLVGQLSGALASTLGIFALYELYKRLNKSAIQNEQLKPLILIYFVLLIIARIYAEIPLTSAFLLLVSPAAIAMRGRYSAFISVISVGLSLAWVLMTADASSYY